MTYAVEPEGQEHPNPGNRLAKTSLWLALVGWVVYLLQWCFDLTLGLLLAAVTAGASAACGTVLDILPFILWISGIIAGHAALSRLRQANSRGKGAAAWGLILSYLGLFFTIIFIGVTIFLVSAGIHSGWFGKIIPGFHLK